MRRSKWCSGLILHLHGEEFGEADAGEDQQRPEGLAATESFMHENERTDPGEDWFGGKNERSVRGSEVLLRPALHRERRGGGEYGGDQQSDDQRGAYVDVRVLEDRQGDGHDDRAETDLQHCELFEVNFAGEVGEAEQMEGERECAAEREDIAEVDAGAGRGRMSGKESGSGEQGDSEERDDRSGVGIPAGTAGSRERAGQESLTVTGREQR